MNAVAELTEAQRVVLVDPNDLPKLWDQLRPLIEKACVYSAGQFDAKTVVDGVMAGDFALVAYLDGEAVGSVAVLTVSQFRTGLRILEVLLASGDQLRDWVRFESHVADYGRKMGCSRFRMIGREGLARMLPHWKRTSIVLEKEFD